MRLPRLDPCQTGGHFVHAGGEANGSSVTRTIPEGDVASGADPERFWGGGSERGVGFDEVVVDVKCQWNAHSIAPGCVVLLEGAVSARRVSKIPKGDVGTCAIPTNAMHRILASVRSATGGGTDTDSTKFILHDGPAVSPWAKEGNFLPILLVLGPRDTEFAPFP